MNSSQFSLLRPRKIEGSWKNQRVAIGGISFEVSEEVIAQATSLSLEGRQWKWTSHVTNSDNLNKFFKGKEAPVKLQGGFTREELQYPWNLVCLMVMKYFTLEGHHKVYYYYHMPLLNHFRNHDLLCLPFYLLHSLENSIKEALDPKNEDKQPIPLHQGLIYKLYRYHSTLYPHRNIM